MRLDQVSSVLGTPRSRSVFSRCRIPLVSVQWEGTELRSEMVSRLRKLAVASATASIVGVAILGGASAASAFGETSGGYNSCGSGTVLLQSSSTGSLYHRRNGSVLAHWVDSGSTQVLHISNTGASAIVDWKITTSGVLGYGYPRCLA